MERCNILNDKIIILMSPIARLLSTSTSYSKIGEERKKEHINNHEHV